ncbi:hypothetical protein [Halocatena salina]|uniref:Uncharacterized protein n=1 Tax=Halocatena salina TaxID=2934340 RepID=A0A8U0A2L7_9EURY|nr:hypothetical protein [Halocatena salina]UPM43415.1 hypothetical protein MW046_02965 [Halocatena salina]
MQTTEADGHDSNEQETGQDQSDTYEWWWDDRLMTFLQTADDIAEKCLNQVFGSAVQDHVHVDNLADIEEIEEYHDTLTPTRFIESEGGTYDLNWEIETTDGIVTDVYMTCHAEYVDENREVSTEVDVAIVASSDATETECVTEPHIIHRPNST